MDEILSLLSLSPLSFFLFSICFVHFVAQQKVGGGETQTDLSLEGGRVVEFLVVNSIGHGSSPIIGLY